MFFASRFTRQPSFSLVWILHGVWRNFSALIASKFTVSRYCNAWGIARPVNFGGRPVVLSETRKLLMKRMLLTGDLKTGVKSHQYFVDLYLYFSFTTLNALKSMGSIVRPKRRASFLSRKHQEEFLNWALAHKIWTIHDWRKVIFSDEPKINAWDSDGIEYYWSLPTSELQPYHLMSIVKHGVKVKWFWVVWWDIE